jgi:hypothetical protein
MKKLSFLAAITLTFAATPQEILKKEFNKNILPQIINDLEKDGESILILRVYKTNKSISINTYKVQKVFSDVKLLETKGDYNIGFKYYTKYIFKPAKIKVTDFIKIIGAKTPEDLDELFKNNGEKLIEILQKEKQTYAIKGIEQIRKRGKLNDLKAFLKGVMAGKVPASCS